MEVKGVQRDITEGMHYCHRCKTVTHWTGERKQKCDVCGRAFPCSKEDCLHLDCAEHRKVWGKQKQEAEQDPVDIFAYLES